MTTYNIAQTSEFENTLFPEEVYNKFFYHNKNISYRLNYIGFLDPFLKTICSSKKQLEDFFSLLVDGDTKVFQPIVNDYCIQTFKRQTSISINLEPSILKCVVWCLQLSKKNDNFSFIKQLEKNDYQTIVSDHILNGKSYSRVIKAFNFETLESFLYLRDEKLVDDFDNLYDQLDANNLGHNKGSLKKLMKIFKLQEDERTLKQILKTYPIVKAQDSELKGIFLEPFIKTVNNSTVCEKLKQQTNDCFFKVDKFLDINDKNFFINLNIDKIIEKRKDFKHYSEQGAYFIIALHEAFCLLKDNAIENFECFNDKRQDILKISDHAVSKTLDPYIHAYFLKDFSFSFTTEEDKEFKKNYFLSLVDFLLNSCVNDLKINIEKYNLNYHLKSSLANKTTKKTNKI